ncbi:unnamed protein product [Clavelina lepadiformis]|uniref:G-protein coupled receptors family 1 profile domain-containing protein n=1 Tax=Clavelina lepadiformis TaxID=159417 RepID=A0ABP0F814_CLALP
MSSTATSSVVWMTNATINATTKSEVPSFLGNGEALWIGCQVVVSLCTVADVYVLVCLLLFWKRNKIFKTSGRGLQQSSRRESMWNSENQTDAPRKTPSRHHSVSGSKREKRYKRWMLRLVIGASVTALLKCLIDQTKFFYAWQAKSDNACEIANDVTEVCLYATALMLIYGFLWLRQWLFYQSPAVRTLLYRSILVRFSRWFMVIIVALSSTLAIFHLLPQRYRAHTGNDYVGCVAVYDLRNPSEAWPIVMYITLSSIFQMSLVCLYLYPFVRRQIDQSKQSTKKNNSRKRSRVNSNVVNITSEMGTELSNLSLPKEEMHSQNNCTTKSTSERPLDSRAQEGICSRQHSEDSAASAKQTSRVCQPKTSRMSWMKTICRNGNKKCRREGKEKSKEKAFQSIKRVIVWTTICIFTDITMVAGSLCKGPGMPLILMTSLNDFNILLNILCLIATYSRWRDILFPCCIKEPAYQRERSSSRVFHSCEVATSFRRSISATRLHVSMPNIHVQGQPNKFCV